MYQHSTDDLKEIQELITAVLDNPNELSFETLVIRTGLGRRPKSTTTTTGVFFGTTGRTFGRGGRYRSEGYIVQTPNGARIASSVEFPARQRELLMIEDVATFLGYLVEDKPKKGEAAHAIDVVKWKIKELLPNSHPLKPHARSYESRLGAEM